LQEVEHGVRFIEAALRSPGRKPAWAGVRRRRSPALDAEQRPSFGSRRQAGNRAMADLIVVAYDDEHRALDMRLKLMKLQRDYLIDLEDAVVATKDTSGGVKLHQTVNLTAAGAAGGGFWGALIGLVFLNPLLGIAAGAASGALAGALTDVGINDDFMKELAATLQPGSSAVFVLVRKMTPDRVMDELRGTGGKILRTSLSHEQEERLQAALSANAPPSRPDLSSGAAVGTSPAALGTGTQPQS
jgi:uncharacterized membrane protein